jgi:Flp pilus assembly protein TadG
MLSRRSLAVDRQRSQAMTEFALVAPVLLLLTFGIIDFGRAMFLYAMLGSAAEDAARSAAASSSPLPTDSSLLSIASAHLTGVTLVSATCPQGPVTEPPVGTAWLYVTEQPAPIAYEASPPMNAPGGGLGTTTLGAGCTPVVPASGKAQLEVTIFYSYVPVTPLVDSLLGGHISFRFAVVSRTDY